MTDEQWDEIVWRLQNWWGTPPMDENREAAYKLVLVEHEFVAVDTVLRSLLADGNPFTPAASEIVNRMNRQTVQQCPVFSEAWQSIVRGLRHVSHPDLGVSAAEKQAVYDELSAIHPVLDLFVRGRGVQALCLMNVDVGDNTGYWNMKRLEDAYNELATRYREAEIDGKALAASERSGLPGPAKLSLDAVIPGTAAEIPEETG